MANLDLTQYGITGTKNIIHNPSYEDLYKAEMDPSLEGYEKGQESELGAVNVMPLRTCVFSSWMFTRSKRY